MSEAVIRRFVPKDVSAIIELSLRAWAPVFEKLKPKVLPYVYEAFYPNGWRVRQEHDIRQFLECEGERVFVAIIRNKVVGFVGLRFHPEDQMGEIYIIAVDPDHQRKGIAKALMRFSFDVFKEAGCVIALVDTGDDPGHTGARAAYEDVGFERWPVARYFREV